MKGSGRRSAHLVIGIGNRDRGDDAVGPLVVDAVNRGLAPGREEIEAIVVDGDLSDLADRWHHDQAVFIVDACHGGGEPGTIITVDGLAGPVPVGPAPISSHGIGLAEAIELAKMLDRLPRSMTIVAVEASTFDHFAPVSAPVAEAIVEITERILRLDWAGPKEAIDS